MQTNQNTDIPDVKMLETPQGRQIAARYRPGSWPTVLYIHGYASDMMATKAQFFDQTCAARGQAYVRFDCSANGQSPGDFKDGAIGRWIEDALAVIDSTQGPIVLVGSSMGGWIGLHCALKRPQRIRAFIGIAAAPDFTEKIQAAMTAEQKVQAERDGYHELPSSLGEPLRLYNGLLQDGRKHLLLTQEIKLDIPVVLTQGKLDQEVPWPTAERIKQTLSPASAEIIYVEDGDHRLARPQDMAMIDDVIVRLSKQVSD